VKGEIVSVHITKDYRGSRDISPIILNGVNRLISEVSFTLRLIYLRKTNFPLSVEQEAGWASEPLVTSGEEKNILPPPGIETCSCKLYGQWEIFSSLTSSLDQDKWSASFSSRSVPSVKAPPYLVEMLGGLTFPELLYTFCRRSKAVVHILQEK
jgi:hypothetical protein